MSKSSSKAREISLGDDFGAVIVNVNGARIEVDADSHVVVSTRRGVEMQPAANETAKSRAALQIGEPDDGGIYVGLSAEDGKPLHAALADLPEYKTYGEALEAAEQLKSRHPTAHVPTSEELDKNLFENRNTGHLKGTFNTSGLFPDVVYRSSTPYLSIGARVQWFNDGFPLYDRRSSRLPVRLVW